MASGWPVILIRKLLARWIIIIKKKNRENYTEMDPYQLIDKRYSFRKKINQPWMS